MRRLRVVVLIAAVWALPIGWSTATAGVVASSSQVAEQTPEEAAATALSAALELFGGTADPACRPGQPGPVCVEPLATLERAARGIATFGVSGSGPEGLGAFQGILGRDPGGVWRFWFGTQNVSYQLFALPGELIVCADGDGLNVRAAPSTDAEILDVLPDLTRAQAEQFTLTEEGALPTESTDQVVGAGWYRLSAPVAGWVYAAFVENAMVSAATDQPPCAIRNLFVRR